MLRTQNSPMHRSSNVLCGKVDRRAHQGVSHSSLRRTPSSQYPQLSRSCERSLSSPSISMTSILPPGSNPSVFYTLDSTYAGYAPPAAYTTHPCEFLDYPPVDDGFVGNAYDPFSPTSQSPHNPAALMGTFYELQPPPTPPTAPEESISPIPEYHLHVCRWLGGPQCNGFAPGRNREMGEHLRVHHHFIGHERDAVHCEWQGCGQTIQRMNVARHIVSRHLLAAASCRRCGRSFSRPDVVGRHERTCTGGFPATNSPIA